MVVELFKKNIFEDSGCILAKIISENYIAHCVVLAETK